MNKDKITDKILEAAEQSPEFRAKFIANPKGAIEAFLNFKLPGEFEILVHEDTPNRINIVLPYSPNELTDKDLSQLSGGNCITDFEGCEMLG